jgi:galactokinase
MDGPAGGVIAGFAAQFGRRDGVRVYRAPGRVNLIGEHTDYSLGFVLPVALDLACFAAAAPNAEGRLRVYSKNLDARREWPVEAIAGLSPSGDWTDYVAGVAVQLARAGVEPRPLDLYIDSTVPQGGGLSSSASLEVASALALLDGREIDKVELAKLARAAEVEFAGMPCGIMDQYISVFGQENAALKIDCRSLEFEAVKLPGEIEIAAVNTMVKHELGGSAYRERVAECRAAVEAIRAGHPEVESLRDATAGQLELVEGVPRKRARHVIGENARVEEFVAAAGRGDAAAMGRLFVASHRSLQHDYEVSCEELDFLVDTAIGLDCVYGARMTGGGFGGCTVNLLRPGTSAAFQEATGKAYRAGFGRDPAFYPVRPSPGAGRVA